jgi:hypothetical protein
MLLLTWDRTRESNLTRLREAKISNDERRYSENEFALILRKAIELQERRPGGGITDSADGLTLDDIKAVAAEVGLDPGLIERAAAILPTTTESLETRIFGIPSKYQMEYTAPGRLPKEEFGRVIDAIRQATGHTGKVGEVLGSLEWETVGETSQIHVTVSSREEQTTVKVMADRGPTGAVHFGVIGLIGGLLSMGVAGAIIRPDTVAGVVALVSACMGGSFLAARTIFITTGRGFRSKLRNLMVSATKVIDESVKAPALPGDHSETP